MMMGDNLGMRVVQQIHQLWNVDEHWTVWDQRGFSWWAQDYRQRVWAEPPVNDNGFSVYKLCARTDFIRDIEAATIPLYEKLSLLGKFASTSALVLDVSEKTLRLWTIVYFHEETADWVTKLFSGVAILQPIEAQIRAAEFSKIFGGYADTSAHPGSGQRQDGDEMLKTVELFYAPEGQRPSLWIASREFEEVARLLNQSNCRSTADANGLTAEFPFGERDTSMLMVQTDQRHPQLGNGLLLRLHLPHAHRVDNAPFTAAMLNTLETRLFTRAHLIGSWCSAQMASRGDVPVFVMFIPNALHRRGLLLNLLMSMGMRARWAAMEIQGQSKEGYVKDTLGRRLSKVFSWLRRN